MSTDGSGGGAIDSTSSAISLMSIVERIGARGLDEGRKEGVDEGIGGGPRGLPLGLTEGACPAARRRIEASSWSFFAPPAERPRSLARSDSISTATAARSA